MTVKLIIIMLFVYSATSLDDNICTNTTDVRIFYTFKNNITSHTLTTKDYVIFDLRYFGPAMLKNETSVYLENKDLQDNVFIFQPSLNKVMRENSRVSIKFINRREAVLNISFVRNEDDESQWNLAYATDTHNYDVHTLCQLFVRADKTPFVVIKHHIESKWRFIIKRYTEEDKIVVQCILSKGDANLPLPEFDIVFPKGAKFVDKSEAVNPYTRVKVVTLTKDILNKPIYCNVQNGYSAKDEEILKFYSKFPISPKTKRTALAIVLAAFICLLLLVLTFAGAYIMIVKQRKETTKDLVTHHAEASQRRATIAGSINSRTSISRVGRKSFVLNTGK